MPHDPLGRNLDPPPPLFPPLPLPPRTPQVLTHRRASIFKRGALVGMAPGARACVLLLLLRATLLCSLGHVPSEGPARSPDVSRATPLLRDGLQRARLSALTGGGGGRLCETIATEHVLAHNVPPRNVAWRGTICHCVTWDDMTCYGTT